jgi:hypothetical protein
VSTLISTVVVNVYNCIDVSVVARKIRKVLFVVNSVIVPETARSIDINGLTVIQPS